MQELPANNFLQGAVWLNSTFHVGVDQPEPRTNPITLTLALWGARGRQEQWRGSSAYFGGVFLKKSQAAENPASTNQASGLQEVIRRQLLEIGHVLVVLVSQYNRRVHTRFLSAIF